MNEQELKMFEENQGLVYMIVNNKFNQVKVVDKDDLVQMGNIGLIKSVKTYDPTKGLKFSTYACTCIYREIKKLIGESGGTVGKREERRNNYIGNIANFSELTFKGGKSKSSEEEKEISDFFSTEDFNPNEKSLEEGYEFKEEYKQAVDLVNQLTPTKRKIIYLYSLGYKIADMPSILNMDYTVIRRNFYSARKDIEKMLQGKKVISKDVSVGTRKFTEEKKFANLFKEIAKQSKEMGMTKGNYLKNVLGVAQNTIDKWMLTEVIPRESMKKKVSSIMGLPVDYLFEVNEKFSVEA